MKVKMSLYVLMKILESAPERYDRGIRILTLGKIDKTYDRLIFHIEPEQRVLDIGCGTGALTIKAALKGARVKGIDINSQMLEIARRNVEKAALSKYVELCEMGVGELDGEESESYDVVMSGMCFSELSEEELTYTLKEIMRILRPGGLLLIADETVPQSPLKRVIELLLRIPLVVVTYIFTQTTTKAIKKPWDTVSHEGFIIESITQTRMENFVEIVARKPKR